MRSVKTSSVDWKPIRGVQGDLATLEHQAKTPKLRLFFLGLLIAMPVISFGLGCWQVQRLNWKVELISQNEKSLAQPPIEGLPLHLDRTIVSEEFEYRKFKLKGRFNYDEEIFLGPRMRGGELGYLVIAPFIRSDGGKPILVERGWIKKDKVIPNSRSKGYLAHLAMPQGEIEIVALFRNMPKKHMLHFDHEQGSRLYHTPDVFGMAEQTGAEPIYAQMIYDLQEHPDWRAPGEKKKRSWFFKTGASDDVNYISSKQDGDSTVAYQEFEFVREGVPIAHTAKVKLTNNHMQYLVTWFGLAFCSTGAFIYMIWKGRRYSSADKMIAAKRKDMKRF